ncbi:hypothetical protein BACCAP_01459 [Pseudoflavonifractor capillosus ATCC 29799]|uniref:Uncharacterized protein n=1 Tax=Pseudoflavonifractor capillosus ATCC 29799 TaxID=411467 RepID=A6NTD0_9FIRM|nr:hypothetical protein BACCAP_01459 [Pseudoflavonifractor capillosus ATCC 29799]
MRFPYPHLTATILALKRLYVNVKIIYVKNIHIFSAVFGRFDTTFCLTISLNL